MRYLEEIFKQIKPSKKRGAIIIPITNNKKFKMYRVRQSEPTNYKVNESYEGETIEEKVRRILNNNEPIEDSAPIIWTKREDGVAPEFDVRTDRFEIAVEAMDQVNNAKLSERKLRIASRTNEVNEGNNEQIPRQTETK